MEEGVLDYYKAAKRSGHLARTAAQINNVSRLNESENTTAIAFAVLNPLNAQDMKKFNAVFIPAKNGPRRGSRFRHGQIEFTPK